MTQQTAQGLASLGRGPDSMLVHMAPGEVKSLQQLAMAHGGSLTINPETGLPEAGFLSSLLPALIGGGLTIASGGALSPVMAGLLTGGGYGLATGSLKKGLMAGFGAYGGAGLGSALAGAGATTAGATANALGVPGAATGAGSQAAMLAAQNQGFGQAGLEALGSSAGYAKGAVPLVQSGMQSLGAGAQGLLSEQGRNAFMQNIGGAKGLGMAGLAAAAPMLMETTTKQPEIKSDANMGQRYQFNAGTQTPTPAPDVPEYGNQGLNFGKERRYFNPMYRPIDDAAARKQYNFASGGPVEAMSDANAIGMNTGYPQSGIRTGAYATPDQQPISRDMLPYAGQPQFAGGGSIDPNATQNGLFKNLLPSSGTQDSVSSAEVGGYTYDPVTQMYTKKGGEGATMVSPVGGISGASGSSGSSDYIDPNPGWSGKTPAERAEFFQDPANATHASLRGLAQQIYGYTTPGMIQNFFDPSRQFAEAAITSGQTPQQTFRGSELSNQGNVDAAFTEQMARDQADRDQGAAVGDGNTGSYTSDHGGSFSPSDAGYGVYAQGGLAALAQGGISNLGDYSDGGRLLRGPGDGISDSIPATIGKKRPARLADGEFVVPARIVSELGNGSTEAGARKLYAMMDRVQKARGKTVGKGKVAANSRSAKYLPA